MNRLTAPEGAARDAPDCRTPASVRREMLAAAGGWLERGMGAAEAVAVRSREERVDTEPE